jgi:hypothetical protein
MGHPGEATLRERLGIEKVKAVRAFTDYFDDEFAASFVREILAFIKEVHLQEFAAFMIDLHASAQAMVEVENALAIERKTPKLLRQSRARYAQASICVNRSIKSLLDAENLLREEADKGLIPHSFNFEKPRQALKDLHKRIVRAEADCAARIHPDLRTPTEKRLAKQTLKIEHPPFRITEGSAQLQYAIAGQLEERVRQFSRGKVPSNHIDRFISRFFAAALGLSVSEDNVKTMRLRLKRESARHTTSEQRCSPHHSR